MKAFPSEEEVADMVEKKAKIFTRCTLSAADVRSIAVVTYREILRVIDERSKTDIY